MDAQSGTIIVDGLRLHYLRRGTGQPILLLHGWPTHSFIWRHLMPPLSAFGTVYAPDLPGFGASDKPPDGEYTFTWFSRFVEGFVDALGLAGITLIGHDIGAPAGVLWAVRNPRKVRAVAILNAPIFPWRTGTDRLSQVLLQAPLIGRLLVTPPGLRWLLVANVVRKAVLSADVIRAYQAPFRTSREQGLLRRTILRPLASGRSNELVTLADGIARLGVPLAIIYGTADRLCGRHMEQLAEKLPQASVVRLRECGHYLQEDCPKKLEEALVRFLETVGYLTQCPHYAIPAHERLPLPLLLGLLGGPRRHEPRRPAGGALPRGRHALLERLHQVRHRRRRLLRVDCAPLDCRGSFRAERAYRACRPDTAGTYAPKYRNHSRRSCGKAEGDSHQCHW